MPFTLKYIALHVSDLRAAEDYYARVFAMALFFRESQQDAETWRTLRPDVTWDDAESAGITIDMVALRRDAFVLALFRGTPAPDAVFEFCVGLEPRRDRRRSLAITEPHECDRVAARQPPLRGPVRVPLGHTAP